PRVGQDHARIPGHRVGAARNGGTTGGAGPGAAGTCTPPCHPVGAAPGSHEEPTMTPALVHLATAAAFASFCAAASGQSVQAPPRPPGSELVRVVPGVSDSEAARTNRPHRNRLQHPGRISVNPGESAPVAAPSAPAPAAPAVEP